MRRVFVDTFYWIALLNPKDNYHHKVLEINQSLPGTRLVTTEEVFSELLTFYSKSGIRQRQRTVTLVRKIMDDKNIQVIEQDHESFLFGLTLYEERFDKGYSLADCVSMNVMRKLEITQVLTHDQHFAQEGFTILL